MNRVSIWFIACIVAAVSVADQPGNAAANSAEKLEAPELRYRVLQQFKNVFFCDPDEFPVGLSPAPARQRGLQLFPKIEADQEAFQAITNHLGFKDSVLSDEQRLLVYGEFKKLRGAVHLERSDDQYRFSVGLKEKTGDVSVEGLLAQDGTVTVLKRKKTILMCPICLGVDTEIDTPTGSVLVQKLKSGDKVWTLNAAGQKVAVPVLKTSAVPVSLEHRVIHLVMSDHRELFVSPGHPTADGRTVGQLEAHGTYNGSLIDRSELVLYHGDQTYDLLPAGDSGFYWANGILLASTLR